MPSEHKTFDHLFVLGRPASGKSEFLAFMKAITDNERTRRFRIGRMEILDDFVWLWEKFEEDDLWEKVLGRRLHSKRAGHGYVLDDAALFDFLIEKLNATWQRRSFDERFYAEQTLLIEFSRGGEKPYAPALARFDRKLFERAAILYINVSGQESLRRNEARYREKMKHSILAHKVPDEDMARFYTNDDWEELTDGKPLGFLTLQGINVPFVALENEPESTDQTILSNRYSAALDTLWNLRTEGQH